VSLTLALPACEPLDALHYLSPVTSSLAQQATQAKAVWETTRKGISGVVGANRVNDAWGSTVGVNWQIQPLNTLDAYQSWETNTEGYRKALCADIYHALQAYSTLREAELGVKAAEVHRQMSALAKADMARKQTVGTVTALDVAVQDAACETDIQLAQQAALRLELAQRQADSFGLHGVTVETGVRFQTAAVPIEQMALWKQSRRELLRQQLLVREDKRTQHMWLELGLTTISNDTQLSAKLSSRTQGAAVTIGYPSLYDPSTLVYTSNTTLTLSLNYPLDPIGRAALHLAEATQHTLQTRIEQQQQELLLKQQQALLQIQLFQTTQGGAERQLALARQQYQQQQVQFAGGFISQQALLQGQIHVFDMQQAVLVAWKQYTGAVYDFLTLTDGVWEVSK